MIRYCIETNLSTLLHRDSAALPVGDLPALLVRDLPAVRLGHVPAVVDGDGLAVVAGLEALALAVGRQQHVTPVGGLAGLHVICNTGQSGKLSLGCHTSCQSCLHVICNAGQSGVGRDTSPGSSQTMLGDISGESMAYEL